MRLTHCQILTPAVIFKERKRDPMVKWLQNKNRTDPQKITVETSKETLDQFSFVFLFY